MPPDPDLVFRAALARALAARYDLPLDSLRVQVIGRALCELLRRLDRWRAGRYLSETIQIGPGGQIHTPDEWLD